MNPYPHVTPLHAVTWQGKTLYVCSVGNVTILVFAADYAEALHKAARIIRDHHLMAA